MNYNPILNDTCMEMIADACNHHYIGIGNVLLSQEGGILLALLCGFCLIARIETCGKRVRRQDIYPGQWITATPKTNMQSENVQLDIETSYHIQTIHLEGFKLVSVCAGLKIACAQNCFGFLNGQR